MTVALAKKNWPSVRVRPSAVRKADWPERVYSVEKLKIGLEVFFRHSELTSIRRSMTCSQPDARTRSAASATTSCPLVSHLRSRP